MSEYDGMSVAQLDAEIQRLAAERQALRDQAKRATEARDRQAAAAEAAAKLAAMSEAERAALKAELGP
jgi:hypothetical protein